MLNETIRIPWWWPQREPFHVESATSTTPRRVHAGNPPDDATRARVAQMLEESRQRVRPIVLEERQALRLPRVLVLGAVLLVGCAHTPKCPPPEVRTVTVEVPVPTRPEPTPELIAPIASLAPTFVLPDDPNAKSALTAEGERDLKLLIDELVTRLQAWETWAKDGR